MGASILRRNLVDAMPEIMKNILNGAEALIPDKQTV
jgi:hypothetical protein